MRPNGAVAQGMPLAAQLVPIVATTVQWSIATCRPAPMGTLSLLLFPRRTRRCIELVEFPTEPLAWPDRCGPACRRGSARRERIGRPGGADRPGAPRVGRQEDADSHGRGDRPVQARRVRAQGPRDRALPPRPRDGPPPVHQRLRRQAGRPRRAGAAPQQAGPRPHAQHPRAQHRRRWWQPGDDLPEDRSARTSCGPPASPARASASPSSTPASTATMPDFRNADGGSRIAPTFVTRRRHHARRRRRPRHARRRHHRRQLLQPRRRRPGTRRLRRHRPRGQPGRAQDGRRRSATRPSST